jgi:hypothetical protein
VTQESEKRFEKAAQHVFYGIASFGLSNLRDEMVLVPLRLSLAFKVKA